MSAAPQDTEVSEGIPAGFSSLWVGFPPCTRLQAEIPPAPQLVQHLSTLSSPRAQLLPRRVRVWAGSPLPSAANQSLLAVTQLRVPVRGRCSPAPSRNLEEPLTCCG